MKPCNHPVQVAHLPGPATICATLQHPVQVAHLPRPATFCKQPCKHPVQVAHLHTEMGQLWRQLRIQQQCLGSRPASTSMTRGYWEVPGSRRPALLSSRSSSESWLSVTLSFLMVPTFKLLPLPLPSCMHAMMFCTLHRSACLNVCNGLYLCPGNRLACCNICNGLHLCLVIGWPVVTCVAFLLSAALLLLVLWCCPVLTVWCQVLTQTRLAAIWGFLGQGDQASWHCVFDGSSLRVVLCLYGCIVGVHTCLITVLFLLHRTTSNLQAAAFQINSDTFSHIAVSPDTDKSHSSLVCEPCHDL